MEKERSLDRLITCSKLFRDARFEEICKENAELRLQLFWKDHHCQILKTVMKNANLNSSECNCMHCFLSGRTNEDVEIDKEKNCEFVPWFEEKLAACELIYGNVLRDSCSQDHISCRNGGVWDVDCHFVKLPMIGGDWHAFTCGSKLWKAKTVNDPELGKLVRLFKLLDPDYLDISHYD